MAQTQDNNRIRIDTILNKTQPAPPGEDDPLLLSEVQGTEGISQSFCYEATMLRNTKYHDIPLQSMLNTVARIGFKARTGNFWFCRTGVINHFEELSVITKFRTRDYHTYKAQIVPPFDTMAQQRLFRIFENTNALNVIKTVLDSNPLVKGAYSPEGLDCVNWQNFDHRIQFGEDTCAFISRLMAEFGIWYYYDFSLLAASGLDKVNFTCSPMKLFCSVLLPPTEIFKECDEDSYPFAINGAPSTNIVGGITRAEIGGITRSYDPSVAYFEVGDFNPLQPLRPRAGKAGKRSSANVSAGSHFPAALDRDKDANPAAEQLLDQAIDGTTMISGSSVNPTFAVGRSFTIAHDKDDRDEEGRGFVISTLALHAFDNSIGGQVGAGVVSFLNGWIWEPIKGIGLDIINPLVSLVGGKPLGDPGAAGNISLALAAGGLNNMWKNKIQVDAQSSMFQKMWNANGGKAISAGSPGYVGEPTNLGFATYFEAGAVSAITSVVAAAATVLGKPLQEVWQMADKFGAGGSYGNSFTALPKGVSHPSLPKSAPVIASGPHLAVVIGPNGAVTSDGKDITGIYADALGRVRVRFPWDPGPPADTSQASPPGATITPPAASGLNTCWVRVSQPWAGRAYGAQFLPRIGEEVIVDFIAGDPERPIITGRVYNADHGFANMPFPSDGKAPATVQIATDYLLKPSPPTSNMFTRSGIKTCTVRNGAAVPSEYHLLRFDDNADHEQLLLRSQGRLDLTAFTNGFETIGGNRHLTVGWIDTKHKVAGGDYVAKVFCDYHLHVGDPAGPFNGGHRNELVEKDYGLEVKKDTNFKLDGDWNVSVGGKASISADTIVLKANKSITLIVGNSIIVVQSDGIYNEAPIHYEQCGADGQSATDAVVKPPKAPTHADPG